MGIFDGVQDDYKVSGLRQDDKTGTYWQRIDKIETFNTRNKGEALRVAKTTIHVVSDPEGLAHPVGTSTTQCFFSGDFLTRDLKLACKAAFGMSPEEADQLTGSKLKELLTGGTLHGEVIQFTCKEMVSKKGNNFTNVTWDRRISTLELENKLSPEAKAQYYPEGVSA